MGWEKVALPGAKLRKERGRSAEEKGIKECLMVPAQKRAESKNIQQQHTTHRRNFPELTNLYFLQENTFIETLSLDV